MATLRLTVKLHPQQLAFRRSKALYRAFVGGRGAGKSYAGAFDMIRRMRPRGTYLIGSPTGVLMGDTTYPTFKALALKFGVWGGVKLTPYPTATILLDGGEATVRFRTAEDPDKMRGPNLTGVWLDEASLMYEDAYKVVIACLREDGKQGWLSATFTPKGVTHWTKTVFDKSRPNTELFHSRTGDNPFNPPEFEATLRAQYGNTAFARQEIEGLFVQPEGATFPAEWLSWPGFMVDAFPAEGVTKTALYLDPSQGKDAKVNDDQAFVRAAFWPGPRRENIIYLECVAAKEPPGQMVGRAVRLVRDWRPGLFAFETNGTMGLLAAEVERQFREASVLCRTRQVNNTDPKRWRIKNALGSYLEQKRIRIVDSAGGRLLRDQLSDEPFAVHDDCSDAAAGAVTALESLVTYG